jgi:hypothetical protein
MTGARQKIAVTAAFRKSTKNTPERRSRRKKRSLQFNSLNMVSFIVGLFKDANNG